MSEPSGPRAERLADVAPCPLAIDPAVVAAYLEDASGAAPGRTPGVARVQSEAEAAAWLRRTRESATPVLFQAARSSLTGGAIPRGEVVLSVERLSAIGAVERAGAGGRVTAGPGVRLLDLQSHLAARGYYYPPVPTYQEAMLGGTVSTNAGGAASFKYGTTRRWVRGLRVLLHNGDRLTLERGEALARPGESFRVALSDGGELRVPAPTYVLPALEKISAGYHAADPLDLVDVFVGSEGTLGLVTEITVDLVPLPPAVVTALVFLREAGAGLRLAKQLRDAARRARGRSDARGPDVRAIEWLDGNCLELLRDGDIPARLHIRIPPGAREALLIEAELPEAVDDASARQSLAGWLDGAGPAPDVPLVRLTAILRDHADLDDVELAFPADEARRAALTRLREAAPTRVSELLARHSRRDAGVQKVGGDLIVPFERLGEMLAIYERGFRRRNLRFAVWGHLSDGNLHPNALPANGDEVRLGFEALLEFAAEATRRGGCPLSEHGVGRSPIKQEMLRRFHGAQAIEQMADVKRSLDPDLRIAPGVLLPRLGPPGRLE